MVEKHTRFQKLTQRQKAIYDYIVEHAKDIGYPPTIRQIGDRFGISSPNGVKDHLLALQRKGIIKLHPKTSRGIELLKRPQRGIPLVGRVAAGLPILAEENIEDHITMENFFPTDGRIFALQVKGDSMIGDGIFDGDIVIVRPQKTASNGDIVVALIEDEATVKHFYKQSRGVRLESSNEKYAPIISNSVELAGKVIGVIRRMR
jgi:repressor LexA